MLAVTPDVWTETVASLRACGAGRDECVVYWVGAIDEPDRVDAAIHPVHTATPVHYEVDSQWLNRFWLQLYRERRTVRAQVHTHGGRAGHSPTDDSWPLIHTAGFLSLVLPDFAMRDETLSQSFLVRLGPDGNWMQVRPTSCLRGLP